MYIFNKDRPVKWYKDADFALLLSTSGTDNAMDILLWAYSEQIYDKNEPIIFVPSVIARDNRDCISGAQSRAWECLIEEILIELYRPD